MTTRVSVIGEALVDIVMGHESHVGGSPLNVAVGLARLGLECTLHSRVGDDAFGRLIIEHLERSGVILPPGFVDGARTSTATATLGPDGSASYEFDLHWDVAKPDTSQTSIMHIGSIGAIVESGGAAVRAAVARAKAGVLRSYDPNIRPSIMGHSGDVVARVFELAEQCHLVKLSEEDAEWIGSHTGADPEAVMRRIAAAGVRFAVMTRGGQGCVALVDGQRYDMQARPADLVDTIGAGDSFMSGLLYGLASRGSDRLLATREPLDRERVEHALRTALESAAITVSRSGAEPPSLAELSKFDAPHE